MDTDAITKLLDHIIADATQAKAVVAAGATTLVRAGENLQAALDKGGSITLEDGATFAGGFVLKVPGTRVFGAKANLVGGPGVAALSVPPGAKDVKAFVGTATTPWDQRVVMVGDNDPAVQSRLDQVPDGVEITCFVPKHRGKTAFWINGSNVKLTNCGCADVYDPAVRDSQGVSVLNTPGPVAVSGGVFQAGTEIVMVGGDKTGIPNVNPTNVVFEDVVLSRPIAWKTDGVNRKVKNCFELKAGINVVLRRARLDGCWVQAQVGWALMLTPRDGKQVKNVLVEDVVVANVGGGFDLAGYDDAAYTPQTQGVTFRRTSVSVVPGFGTGRFGMLIAEPAGVTVDDCTFDGSNYGKPPPVTDDDRQSTISSEPGTVWDTPTSSRIGSIVKGVRIVNSKLTMRGYGVMVNGNAYGLKWQDGWPDGVISGNTFVQPPDAGLAAFAKKNLPPDNTWIPG
jgi:hypothetical protein